MPTSVHYTVLIDSDDMPPRKGTWQAAQLEKRERLGRAAKVVGVCWLVGLAVLPIPFVHLVVPPLMLVAGPILGVLRYRMSSVAERVSGVCPVHGEPITITLEPTMRPPLWTYCPSCKAPLRISAEAGAAGSPEIRD